MASHTIKQLGQLRPANTTAASAYSPASSTQTIIHNVIVCNVTGSSVKYRLFVDSNGTTYDETTAISWDIDLAANSTDMVEVKICMDDSTGNLAVRTDTANAINFTVNGEEFVA